MSKEAVNHPSHYEGGGIEVIDAIEAWGLNFSRGAAVKYIARAGRKDPAKAAEDMRKAAWYCVREAERIESAAAGERVEVVIVADGEQQ